MGHPMPKSVYRRRNPQKRILITPRKIMGSLGKLPELYYRYQPVWEAGLKLA